MTLPDLEYRMLAGHDMHRPSREELDMRAFAAEQSDMLRAREDERDRMRQMAANYKEHRNANSRVDSEDHG